MRESFARVGQAGSYYLTTYQRDLIVWGQLILTVIVLRTHNVIRAFPSLDDFAYIPLSQGFLDRSLFPDDVFVSGSTLHAPAWALVTWLSQESVGHAMGFWIATLTLSFFSVLVIHSLMEKAGGGSLLLPFAAVLAFANRAPGLGRGLYDGAFGAGFHAQWLALLLMLWAYDSWLGEQPLLAGALVGFCFAAHPAVGLHAGLVLVIAHIVSLEEAKPILTATIAAGSIALPFSIPLLGTVLRPGSSEWPVSRLIEEGLIYRTPHQYSLQLTTPAVIVTLLLVVAMGIVGSVILMQLTSSRCLPAFFGLVLGHFSLAVLFFLFHGGFLPDSIVKSSTLPYMLDFGRSTPVLVVLCAVLIASALEAMFTSKKPTDLYLIALRLVYLVGIAFLFTVYVAWSLSLILLLLISVALVLGSRLELLRKGAIAAVAVGCLAGGTSLWSQRAETVQLPAAEEELFEWVRAGSFEDDLFVVPPGFEQFRYFTRRGVYVDFKVFPHSTPRLIPEWRRRLELIAPSDGVARELTGWPAVMHLDRIYAQTNDSGRIAQILSETEADYLVWDSQGEEIPPYADRIDWNDGSEGPVTSVFENRRFRVFALRDAP